jgi:hypothetical protein
MRRLSLMRKLLPAEVEGFSSCEHAAHVRVNSGRLRWSTAKRLQSRLRSNPSTMTISCLRMYL